MSHRKSTRKALQTFFAPIGRLSQVTSREQAQAQANWLLRSLIVTRGQLNPTNAGFVLPTVVMVTLVVVLLTTAMVLRSFDRAKNASNVRVNQAVLNAASPALDRARAKLDELFEDPNLPRATPSDRRLRDVIDDVKYTYADEIRLRLVTDLNGNTTFDTNSTDRTNAAYRLENDESSNVAWKFPVDTDNNGRFDSYTLYTIAWRIPPRNASTGAFTRPRSPLDARTPPMSINNIGNQCLNAAGTSASLVGDSGWYVSNGKIVKSFFVYAATVPILAGDPALSNNRYESNNKNKGFSALEAQQDRARVPLNNNAVLYEDDLDITPGPRFRLNGRVFTNSNLFTTASNEEVSLYQVSSQNSCYYRQENSKILVGGNVGKGQLIGNTATGDTVNVHLFAGEGTAPNFNTPPTITDTNQSTTQDPRLVAYNSRAYNQRIDFLVQSAELRPAANDPQEVQEDIQRRRTEDPSLSATEARRRSLDRYFRNRTRRIPYAEVPFGQEATLALRAGGTTYTTPTTTVFPATGPLRAPDEWIYPVNLNDGTSFTTLTLRTAQPPATAPQRLETLRREERLGDRILIGNNLPSFWYDPTAQRFVGSEATQPVRISGTNIEKWTAPNTVDRTRSTRSTEISDLGDTGRNGFWELAAAAAPNDPLQGIGGLRVITGAGVYSPDPTQTFLPAPPDSEPTVPAAPATPLSTYDDPLTPEKEEYRVVWPDTMPMSRADDPTTTGVNEADANIKGHLKMRANVVYHYDVSSYNPNNPTAYQRPVACVSSYYDSTNNITARNLSTLPDVSGGIDTDVTPDGLINTLYDGTAAGARPTTGAFLPRSNNGVSYTPSASVAAGSITAGSGPSATTKLFTPENSNLTTAGNLRDKLNYQANLVHPNGRFANQALRTALTNLDAGRNLSLADQSAIDSALCSLQILSGELSQSETYVPHGAIKETSFLDARQVKSPEGRTIDVGSGYATGTQRVYFLPDITGIRVGDVVSVQGFESTTAGNSNQSLLNVVKARVTAVNTTNNTITVESPYRTGVTIGSAAAPISSKQASLTELLTSRSDRAIEQRQPLEVRSTVIDLNRIRSKQITTGAVVSTALGVTEYLLPNSGIIYAAREDAAPDLSEPLPIAPTTLTDEQRNATQRLLSPVDYRTDPSRRPNAVMLVNGSRLNRTDDNNYRAEEKGLILATDLPVYLQGDTLRGTTDALRGFNLHNAEEFTQKLSTNPTWDAAYFYNTRTTPDPEFACRRNTPGLNCDPGDYWRPASIISDAVTLLSSNYQLGYRDNGDFDLRNNEEGWETVRRRRVHGFFDNNFVTSRFFTDADYSGTGRDAAPPATYLASSYFNNFVTPIQRRVQHREYLMEMCVKLPISSCGQSDWWVRPPGTNGAGDLGLKATAAADSAAALTIGTNRTDTVHAAGTTAQPAIPEFRHYPRRVAFARNTYGALEFTAIGGTAPGATAIPIGISGTGTIARFPYNGGLPRTNTNALWYATVKNVNTAGDPGQGNPGYTPNRTYANNFPLYYLPPQQTGNKLILPDTQCFTNTAIVSCGGTQVNGIVNLNLPITDKASDYTLCMDANGNNGGQSRRYSVTQADFQAPLQTDCGAAPRDAIDAAVGAGSYTGLNQFTANNTSLAGNTLPLVNSRVGSGTLRAVGPVTVYSIPADIQAGATITLDANGQTNPVFVLKAPSSGITFNGVGDPISSGTCSATNFPAPDPSEPTLGGCGVRIKVVGVSPNDVFWVGNFRFNTAHAQRPHSVAGNFIADSGAAPNLGAYTNIDGGRFLGYTQAPNFPTNTTFTAVTSDGQPLLAPVLQVQVTTGAPTDTNDLSTISTASSNVNANLWMQRAVANNFNVVIASGDSPARVADPASTATSWIESNGGLHNFPRFLENWTNVTARITGSFIQFKRSAYATAPFQPVLLNTTAAVAESTTITDATATSLFGTDYRQAYRTGNGKIGNTSWGRFPFYEAPNREWGYDVALLTQLPDLFAQRFTVPQSTRDEFYRQVDRNDTWLRTLLCATQPSNVANAQARQSGAPPAGTTFTPALPPVNASNPNPYRPNNCLQN